MSQNFSSSFTGTSGADLVSWLTENFKALASGHSGSSAPAYATRGILWADTSVTNFTTYKFFDGADWISLFTVDEAANAVTFSGADARYAPSAQCRLVSVSTSTIRLDPEEGNKILIGGVVRSIPAAGVSLSYGSQAAGDYYVYAYLSGSSIALEASLTAPATDSTTGIKLKTGDTSRTLVGAVNSTGTGWLADTSTSIGVLSWYNRRLKSAAVGVTTQATSSPSFIALGGVNSVLMTWGDTPVLFDLSGRASNNTAGQSVSGTPFLDGAAVISLGQTGAYSTGVSATANNMVPLGQAASSVPAFGKHTFNIAGAVSAGQGTFSMTNTVTVWG